LLPSPRSVVSRSLEVMPLRDFLYLDRTLVRDFLAQAEGGQIDEERSRANTTGNLTGGIQLGLNGLGAKAAASKGASSETEMVIRQVGPSEFERLHNYLDGNDDFALLEIADEADEFSLIRRQSFLEVDGKVKAAGLGQLLSLVAQIGSAMKQVEAFGNAVSIDNETAQLFKVSEQFGAAPSNHAVILTVPGEANFKVGVELKPEFVLSTDLEVDATALVKVQRVLRPGESRVLGDPFGGLLSKVPQEQLDEMMRSLNENAAASAGLIPDVELRAPGILATPVAIWR
jgi:hypothetical protein